MDQSVGRRRRQLLGRHINRRRPMQCCQCSARGCPADGVRHPVRAVRRCDDARGSRCQRQCIWKGSCIRIPEHEEAGLGSISPVPRLGAHRRRQGAGRQAEAAPGPSPRHGIPTHVRGPLTCVVLWHSLPHSQPQVCSRRCYMGDAQAVELCRRPFPKLRRPCGDSSCIRMASPILQPDREARLQRREWDTCTFGAEQIDCVERFCGLQLRA
mmetsp:Transcript_40075/g.113624  ORF Transcript_40075/g.113624 Transcript_40075/m.113624 type:complete len:212 (-) Transcript_40075:951-1586(-)